MAIYPLVGFALGAEASTSTTIGAASVGGGDGSAGFPALGPTTATSCVGEAAAATAAFAGGAFSTPSAGGAAAADGTRVNSWKFLAVVVVMLMVVVVAQKVESDIA